MKSEILFCKSCKRFTLEASCKECNSKTFSPKPVKYSPIDRWGNYRRMAKRNKKV